MAPALIGERLNYDSLEVSSGMDLQVYADLLLTGMMDDVGLDGAAGASGAEALGVNPIGLNTDGSPITKDQMIESLLAYCRQDTLAMVELVKWLMAQK